MDFRHYRIEEEAGHEGASEAAPASPFVAPSRGRFGSLRRERSVSPVKTSSRDPSLTAANATSRPRSFAALGHVTAAIPIPPSPNPPRHNLFPGAPGSAPSVILTYAPPRSESPARSPSPPRFQRPAGPAGPANHLHLPPPAPHAPPTPRSASPARTARAASPVRQPFAFTPVDLSARPSPQLKPNQRRGHRYKHSSVSMNFFQEPPARAPLSVPAALPIPTFRELLQSVTSAQRLRLIYCATHVIFGAFMAFYGPQHSKTPTSLATLAHLVTFDALRLTLHIAVDVLGNFAAWRQSSVRHPFGLERVSVLVGFALAVSFVFLAGDLVSHAFETIVEAVYGPNDSSGVDSLSHSHSHSHSHISNDSAEFGIGRSGAAVVFPLLAAAVASTLIAATLQTGTGSGSGSGTRNSEPRHLSQPTPGLTATVAAVLAVLAVLPTATAAKCDQWVALTVALIMGKLGYNLLRHLAAMLLLSFDGPDKLPEVRAAIRRDAAVVTVQHVAFFRVHPQLAIGCVRVAMSGSDDDEARVRRMCGAALTDHMAAALLPAGVSFETTVDVTRM